MTNDLPDETAPWVAVAVDEYFVQPRAAAPEKAMRRFGLDPELRASARYGLQRFHHPRTPHHNVSVGTGSKALYPRLILAFGDKARGLAHAFESRCPRAVCCERVHSYPGRAHPTVKNRRYWAAKSYLWSALGEWSRVFALGADDGCTVASRL